MSDIRFLHSDYWRLAESIAGLAAAPEWLRRQARDATRDAVLCMLQLAKNHRADFVFLGGCCTDDTAFHASVADWLNEPVSALQRQGIQVVMPESRIPVVDALADLIVRPGERVNASHVDGRVQLTTSNTSESVHADLAVSTVECGPSHHATCNYLFSPQLRHEVAFPENSFPIYSAGASQSHGPSETGAFGCLLVTAEPGHREVTARFHSTDTLRFETRTIDGAVAYSRQQICDEIVEKSRALTRQVSLSTVVDWRITSPVEHGDALAFLRPDHILESVRVVLQTGHLGVWPRRVVLCPPSLQMTKHMVDTGTETLRTLLLNEASSTGHSSQSGFEQLVTGARLLNPAA